MQQYNRSPRFHYPMPEVEIDVPAPQEPSHDERPPLWQSILPMSSLGVIAVFYLVASQFTGRSGIFFIVPMCGMSIVMMGVSVMMFHAQTRSQQRNKLAERKQYLRQLNRKETRLIAGNRYQHERLQTLFPSVDEMFGIVSEVAHTYLPSTRLWDRWPGHPDFLTVRIGHGEAPSAIAIKAPEPDSESEDILEARRVAESYRKLSKAPVILDFKRTGSIALVGRRREAILRTIRAIIAQLSTFSAPDDVEIYVISTPEHYEDWRWLRWLPHTSATHHGGIPHYLAFTQKITRRVMSNLSARLEQRVEAMSANNKDGGAPLPIIVLVLDDHYLVTQENAYAAVMQHGLQIGTLSICICKDIRDVPEQCGAVVQVSSTKHAVQVRHTNGEHKTGHAEWISEPDVNALARRMSPIRMQQLGTASRIPNAINFMELFEANDFQEIPISDSWSRLPGSSTDMPVHEKLPRPVAIGSETYASPLYLHLAENEHGPHGVIAGTTGSGKSELLQTLVLALAVEHHPYLVNFLLLDYKGGATFDILKPLPHTVGTLSNLERPEMALRALEGIKAEIDRRMRFLRQFEDVEDIADYHRRYLGSYGGIIPPGYQPLPHLLIIIDEFAQLALKLPDFIPELVKTVQQGRSLGIHLILAAQRPMGVIKDDMKANLNFKLCLRVQSPEDSREILGRTDAASIPSNLPGRGFFQVGFGSAPRLFQVARVGIEFLPGQSFFGTEDEAVLQIVRLEETHSLISNRSRNSPNDNRRNLAGELGLYMKTLAERHGIQEQPSPILPPLPDQLGHDTLWKKITKRMSKLPGGWDGERWTQPSPDIDFMSAPIGILDDLHACTQDPFWVNLHALSGNLLVVGASKTGKSTLLITYLLNLMLLHSPEQLHVYGLGFGGRVLKMLEAFPHVGSVVSSSEDEKVRRLLREQTEVLEKRRQSTENYHQILIVVDNFAEFKQRYEDQLDDIRMLVNEGKQNGISVIVTAAQRNDIPPWLTASIEQRIAFRLADSSDYTDLVGRPGDLPLEPVPGRCYWRTGENTEPAQIQIALPHAVQDSLAESIAELAESMHDVETQVLPQPVGMLPRTARFIDYFGSPRQDTSYEESLSFTIGLDDHTLSPYTLTPTESGGHFLVVGSSGSGKSAFLASVGISIANHYAPQQAQLVIVDMLQQSIWTNFAELPHTLAIINDTDELSLQLRYLFAELQERKQHGVPNQDGQFPAIHILIDDYENLIDDTDVARELEQLARHVRKDRHLDFHIWLGGLLGQLERNLSDPLLKEIRFRRTGMSLGTAEGLDVIGGHVPANMRRKQHSEGRGYFRIRNRTWLLQGFIPPVSSSDYLVHRHWQDHRQVSWMVQPVDNLSAQTKNHVRAPVEVTNMPDTGDAINYDGSGWATNDQTIQEYIEHKRRYKEWLEENGQAAPRDTNS